jgi:hypothetical protein
MNRSTITSLASIVGAAAALLLASPAHALYTTLDPAASVSQVAVNSYSLTGGTAAVTFASTLKTALYDTSFGKPASFSTGYNVLSTTYNAAGVATSEVRQQYETSTYVSTYGVDFTLTGMSVATFDARLIAASWASASVSADGSGISEVLPNVYARSVTAGAAILVTGAPFNANAAPQEAQSSVSATAFADPNGLTQSGSWLASFTNANGSTIDYTHLTGALKNTSLAFLNLTGAAISGRLEMRTFTTVTNLSATQVVAVPEADATVLALAGAGLVGLLVKRRRVRA